MTTRKPIVDPLAEYILEEGWQIKCRLMREMLTELGEEDPPTELLFALMVSQRLINKWLEFAQKN